MDLARPGSYGRITCALACTHVRALAEDGRDDDDVGRRRPRARPVHVHRGALAMDGAAEQLVRRARCRHACFSSAPRFRWRQLAQWPRSQPALPLLNGVPTFTYIATMAPDARAARVATRAAIAGAAAAAWLRAAGRLAMPAATLIARRRHRAESVCHVAREARSRLWMARHTSRCAARPSEGPETGVGLRNWLARWPFQIGPYRAAQIAMSVSSITVRDCIFSICECVRAVSRHQITLEPPPWRKW